MEPEVTVRSRTFDIEPYRGKDKCRVKMVRIGQSYDVVVQFNGKPLRFGSTKERVERKYREICDDMVHRRYSMSEDAAIVPEHWDLQ